MLCGSGVWDLRMPFLFNQPVKSASILHYLSVPDVWIIFSSNHVDMTQLDPFKRHVPESAYEMESGGGAYTSSKLLSLSCSGPWVTDWASSCLTFSNANDQQCWKPQIGPFKSSVWCLVRPCSCWRPWFFSSPPSKSLCAVVIGTDVPLASHRATFP